MNLKDNIEANLQIDNEFISKIKLNSLNEQDFLELKNKPLYIHNILGSNKLEILVNYLIKNNILCT